MYSVSHLMFLLVCMSLSKYMSVGVHLQLDLVSPSLIQRTYVWRAESSDDHLVKSIAVLKDFVV